MSTVKAFHYPDGPTFFSKRNTLDDVLDLKRFLFRDFRSFKELLGLPTEQESKRKAKDLFYRMFDHMLTDMLEHNDHFVMPKHRGATLRIGDVSKSAARGLEHVRRDILFDDKLYGGMVVMHKLMRAVIGNRRYQWKLTRRTRARLEQLKQDGQRWPS